MVQFLESFTASQLKQIYTARNATNLLIFHRELYLVMYTLKCSSYQSSQFTICVILIKYLMTAFSFVNYQVSVYCSFSYFYTHWWRGFLGPSGHLALGQYVYNKYSYISLPFPFAYYKFCSYCQLVSYEGLKHTIAVKLPFYSYAFWSQPRSIDWLCIFIEECACCKCMLKLENVLFFSIHA